MPRVMTRCPETGAIVPTQLDMGAKALAKVGAALAIYCRVCGVGHIVEPEQMWLGSDVPGVHPLAGTPWAHRLGGVRSGEGGAAGYAPADASARERRLDVSGEPILSPATTPRRGEHLTSR